MTQNKNLLIMSIFRRISPWMVVAVLVAGYAFVILAENHYDPMVFVNAGSLYDPNIPGNTVGYDGQFSYYIARDPVHAWSQVDDPAYRYRRILYPILAGAVSLGNERAIPWALMLINIAALAGTVFLAEKILTGQGHSKWYAVPYGIFIGSLMSVRLDLTEPLAFLLLQAGIIAWWKQKMWLSAVLFALAILTKEIVLPVIAGLWLYGLLHDKKWNLRWAAISILPFMLCLVALRAIFGGWGLGSGGAYATSWEVIPYFGWWKLALYAPQQFGLLSLLTIPMTILPTLAVLAMCLWKLFKKDFSPLLFSLLLYSLFFPFLPSSIILDPLGVSRLTSGLVLLLINFGAFEHNKRVLNYNMLWIFTSFFVIKDSFLPVGRFK